MVVFSFHTKVASRTPSSYGWKSANQAGPCCKECDGNAPHRHPGRLSKRVAGDGRLVAARPASAALRPRNDVVDRQFLGAQLPPWAVLIGTRVGVDNVLHFIR